MQEIKNEFDIFNHIDIVFTMGNSQSASTQSITTNKLVHIANDKLEINDDNLFQISTVLPCYVIAMVGCARIGKSTYINAFLSHLLNCNIDIAKTSASYQHCTTGIDYICFEHNGINIIILDSQGLNYDDSKYDDKLLTFLYSVSNVVIYHCNNIIDNQTLNSLTSLCIVSNYVIDANILKPKLYFRIRDYSLDANPEDFLRSTFELKCDQYDGVRNAIKTLFPEVGVFTTETLNKKILNEINVKRQYDKLDDEYNFISTFDIIMSNVQTEKCLSFAILLDKLHSTLNVINNIDNVTYKNYDYYTLLIDKEFNDFWKTIDPYVYIEIKSSKYQLSIDKCNKIIDIVLKHSDNCFSHFKSIDTDLLIDKCEKQKHLLLDTIYEKIEENYKYAQKYIDEHVNEVLKSILTSIKNKNLFIDRESDVDKVFEQIFTITHDFIQEKFEDINNKAVQETQTYYKNQLTAIKMTMHENVKLMNEEYTQCCKEFLDLVQYFKDTYIGDFINNNLLLDSPDKLVIKNDEVLRDELMKKIHKQINTMLVKYTLYRHKYFLSLNNNIRPGLFAQFVTLPLFDNINDIYEDALMANGTSVTYSGYFDYVMTDIYCEKYTNMIESSALTYDKCSFTEDVFVSIDGENPVCKFVDFSIIKWTARTSMSYVFLKLGLSYVDNSDDKLTFSNNVSNEKLPFAHTRIFISTKTNVVNLLTSLCKTINYDYKFIETCVRKQIQMENCEEEFDLYDFEDGIINRLFGEKILSQWLDDSYLIK